MFEGLIFLQVDGVENRTSSSSALVASSSLILLVQHTSTVSDYIGDRWASFLFQDSISKLLCLRRSSGFANLVSMIPIQPILPFVPEKTETPCLQLLLSLSKHLNMPRQKVFKLHFVVFRMLIHFIH